MNGRFFPTLYYTNSIGRWLKKFFREGKSVPEAVEHPDKTIMQITGHYFTYFFVKVYLIS